MKSIGLCVILANLAIFTSASDWWQRTVFYQIYPRSFKDSDGDGIGDLKGVTENMEHFVDAGVGAIWLSPIFQSPMIDFGYDISDFRQIHSEYGTIEDFEDLLERAKQLGLKVVLDFVPNHSSTESEYFKQSLNKSSDYADFFIWDDGLPNPDLNNGTRLPPSNWVSQFQGSAWEWREERQQYYLHQFSIEQPDFNYRNPKVREEMKNVLRFWLDKGVDGFRMDAMPYLMEARKEDYGGRYPDDPLTYAPGLGPDQLGYTFPLYTKDLPELYDLVYEWRQVLDSYKEKDGETRVMLTEGYANLSNTMKYFGNETHQISMIPFNFDFITNANKNSNARDIVYTALRWLTYVPNGQLPNWVFGNHDNSRVATRFGSHLIDGLNMLDMILPGVAITYQGDELGMEDGYVSYQDTVDVSGCNAGPDHYQQFSRDPARTPFQWNNSTNAGFSNATKTWLPVGQDYLVLNLENQKQANKSHYKVYQAMTWLRNSPTLQKGDWDLRPLSDQTFSLVRSLPGSETVSLVINVGPEPETVDLTSLKLPQNLTVYYSSVNSPKNNMDPIDASSVYLIVGESVICSFASLSLILSYKVDDNYRLDSVMMYAVALLVCFACVSGHDWWDDQMLYYQVEVKSFKDTDGNGIGDINGITEGLNHFKSLKIDAIVLSPIYKMHNDCNQYGVESFTQIDDDLGTIDDFDLLIKNSKKSGIRVVMDLNLDEISSASDWFLLCSNESEQEGERDAGMYIDRDSVEYPKLNYKSANLTDRIKDVLRYWLERDVSAFRIRIRKETEPEMIEAFQHIKEYVDFYSKYYGDENKALIGEFEGDSKDVMHLNGLREAFTTIFISSFTSELDLSSTSKDVKYLIEKMMTYTEYEYRPTWILKDASGRLSNHFGLQNSESLAMASFLLPGSVVMMQGDEIGMFDMDVDSNVCKAVLNDQREMKKLRSSMPFYWDDTQNAGFSNGSNTWIKIGRNYKNMNLLSQKRISRSTYRTFQSLASFRKSPMIKSGDFTLHTLPNNILAFSRKVKETEVAVILVNFGTQTQWTDLDVFSDLINEMIVIISNDRSSFNTGDKVTKNRIKLSQGEFLVLMSSGKQCQGGKPVDKIMTKLSDAYEKVNVFLNIEGLFKN